MASDDAFRPLSTSFLSHLGKVCGLTRPCWEGLRGDSDCSGSACGRLYSVTAPCGVQLYSISSAPPPWGMCYYLLQAPYLHKVPKPRLSAAVWVWSKHQYKPVYSEDALKLPLVVRHTAEVFIYWCVMSEWTCSLIAQFTPLAVGVLRWYSIDTDHTSCFTNDDLSGRSYRLAGAHRATGKKVTLKTAASTQLCRLNASDWIFSLIYNARLLMLRF